MEKAPVSVEILTFNNEMTIEATLKSVLLFDEILVIDGGSTDRTLDIARHYGAKILAQDEKAKLDGRIADFSLVRNQGLGVAKHRWFLFIDSDEMLTPELAAEIRGIAAAEQPLFYAWNVPRKYVLKGAVIDCATTYPNMQMRFFHREHIGTFVKQVHERVLPNPGETVGALKHHMLVPLPPQRALWEKWQRYLTIEEKRWQGVSRRGLLVKIFNALKPIALYFVRLPWVLFCGGRRMPMFYEIAYQRYNLSVLLRLVRHFLWN
ncbi:MAG: Glycosyl transferase, family 2 [Parcubacteria group bacterium GW2011_GWA1_51_12]|nr:MAG: Glycosyl transferase, family 2 [Parcubacteria group bacterium GW2011_GWA1_51_12]